MLPQAETKLQLVDPKVHIFCGTANTYFHHSAINVFTIFFNSSRVYFVLRAFFLRRDRGLENVDTSSNAISQSIGCNRFPVRAQQ